MANKFYVDTSIWRDYFEDRKDNMKPLGEFAFQFLKKCKERNYIIIITNEVIRELLIDYSKERVQKIFENFKEQIISIDYTNQEYDEAKKFWIKSNKRFPISDILHSIIARDNAAILISRDWHFNEIGIVKCLLPEEVD
ncbi:MAG: PIN domain-containing protein [archaeon]|nr:PIN domain-containing protein [archaeon]